MRHVHLYEQNLGYIHLNIESWALNPDLEAPVLAQVQETSVQCIEAVSHMCMEKGSFQEVTPRGGE